MAWALILARWRNGCERRSLMRRSLPTRTRGCAVSVPTERGRSRSRPCGRSTSLVSHRPRREAQAHDCRLRRDPPRQRSGSPGCLSCTAAAVALIVLAAACTDGATLSSAAQRRALADRDSAFAAVQRVTPRTAAAGARRIRTGPPCPYSPSTSTVRARAAGCAAQPVGSRKGRAPAALLEPARALPVTRESRFSGFMRCLREERRHDLLHAPALALRARRSLVAVFGERLDAIEDMLAFTTPIFIGWHGTSTVRSNDEPRSTRAGTPSTQGRTPARTRPPLTERFMSVPIHGAGL